jgi:prepilin-type N-terminal cleavage/methylation domain-containing protein
VKEPASNAFSLVEMLVALAVLSLMMIFMFNVVAQATQAWETGGRRMEAAQAARVGLERMSFDLQQAMAGRFAAATLPDTNIVTNNVPFFSGRDPRNLPGETGALVSAPSSDQIFVVAPVAESMATNGPFAEVGFIAAYNTRATGFHTLTGLRYYLLRHNPFATRTDPGVGQIAEPNNNFYYRGNTTNNTNWITDAAATTNRFSLIENCYQMQLVYASNTPSGLSFSTNVWTDRTSLPAGVLVTVKVMDAKTAARVAQVAGAGGLTPADVESNSTTPVGRILRAGTVEVSRFIPFLNSTN